MKIDESVIISHQSALYGCHVINGDVAQCLWGRMWLQFWSGVACSWTDSGSHFWQYFTVPLPFLQESSGIHRNPQESSGMAPESAGILRNPQESSGIRRNGTGIELKSSGMSVHSNVCI